MLSRKISKFYITFALGISPDSAPYPISGVLRDRRQSESKICIQGSSTCALCSNDHNFIPVYRI
jgi:hypothetical protein